MKRPITLPLILIGMVLLACRAVPAGIPLLSQATQTPEPIPTAARTPTPLPTPTDLPTGTPTAAPSATTAAAVREPLILKEQASQAEDQKLHTTITLLYPFLDPAAPQAAKFNAAMQALVDSIVSQFKQAVIGLSDFPTDVPGSYLEVKYTLYYSSADLLSVQLQTSSYIKGAAHPNSFTDTLNYDLRKDRELALADLFRPGSTYLETVAAGCKTELKKHDYFDFPEGADPKLENYRSWNITPGGLRVTFDPYQVAAYAAGPQVVTLPWPSLANLLNPSLALPIPEP